MKAFVLFVRVHLFHEIIDITQEATTTMEEAIKNT
jgi:hypothetical protein